MDRILRDAGGTILLTTYDTSGVVADVDGTNAPTVTVTNSAGSSQAGFTPSRTGTGAYQATLPANFETLDLYDVLWTWPNGQTRRTAFELVGSFLFAISDMKAFDNQLNVQTAAVLRDLREEIESAFEEWGNQAFTRRGFREFRDGDGTDTLFLDRWGLASVVAGKVDGVALTSPQLLDIHAYPTGRVVRETGSWPVGHRNIELLVEHGPSIPEPKVSRAGLIYARYIAGAGLLDREERATAVFTDGGEGYRLTIAGRDGFTGLPNVDSVLTTFGHRRIGMA